MTRKRSRANWRRLPCKTPAGLIAFSLERASYNGSIEASQASDVGSIPIARSIKPVDAVGLTDFPPLNWPIGCAILDAVGRETWDQLCSWTRNFRTKAVGGMTEEFLHGRSEREEARSLFRMIDHDGNTTDSIRELIAVSPQVERALRAYAARDAAETHWIEAVLKFRNQVAMEFERLVHQAVTNPEIAESESVPFEEPDAFALAWPTAQAARQGWKVLTPKTAAAKWRRHARHHTKYL